jgi:hypothetical protein
MCNQHMRRYSGQGERGLTLGFIEKMSNVRLVSKRLSKSSRYCEGVTLLVEDALVFAVLGKLADVCPDDRSTDEPLADAVSDCGLCCCPLPILGGGCTGVLRPWLGA